MDRKIQDVKYKISNIRESLEYKDRMNRFEYKFADSLFNDIKNSLDSEFDDCFKQRFYDGKPYKDRFSYETILVFNFYKDNVNQILSNSFRSSIVLNELREMLMESNINVCDISYRYNQVLFYELNENKESSDKEVSIEVSCILDFDYLSFPRLLVRRILKSNFVQSLHEFFRKK